MQKLKNTSTSETWKRELSQITQNYSKNTKRTDPQNHKKTQSNL